MRLAFLFVLPLVAKTGAFGGDVDDSIILFLACLSLCALLVEFLANGGRGRKRRPSVMFYLFLCLFLYAVQGGVLIYARFQAIMERHEQHLQGIRQGHVAETPAAGAKHSATGGVVVAAGATEKTPASSVEKGHRETLLAKGRGKKEGTKGKKEVASGKELALGGNFGGKLSALVAGKTMRTISIVLPCAEERQNALNTVDRFCMRTPEDQLAEIIAVDDGSNPTLASQFADDERRLDQNPRCKLRILRHETTIGLMAAKQTGGKAATGDVVAFFDCHCSPKVGWHREILEQVTLNPRRMVVPGITDLDLDTFDEAKNSAVNAKCYLTFDADFKWFDDDSDFIPTISGGLVAMGREWFNLTGGFDEMMHGWGGENLDQSLRAWLCGGEIVRAQSSRIAHMWRTGDHRTMTRYHIRAKPTNNRGRVATAWFDAFLPAYRGSKVSESEVKNFDEVKKRLGCRPFSYFVYRFRKVYIEGGVIATNVFNLREKSSGLCLTRGGGVAKAGTCKEDSSDQQFQLGNVDRDTGKCCSGIRKYGANDCLDFMDDKGPHWYSCDVTGSNTNQAYHINEEGRLERGGDGCLFVEAKKKIVKKASCSGLGSKGVWEKIHVFEPKEILIYKKELEKHRYPELLPNLPDN